MSLPTAASRFLLVHGLQVHNMPTFVSVVFYIFRGDVVFGGFTVLVGSIEKHPVTCICWTNECSYSYCSLNSTC